MTTRTGDPNSMQPAVRTISQIAVVSDGSAPGSGRPPGSIETVLGDDVAIIERLARVSTASSIVTATDDDRDGAGIVERIGQLPDTVAAVLLTRTGATRARAVQQRIEGDGGRPVLTDEDITAIALTAATSAYLDRIGRDVSRSRILVAGADHLPDLTPLLISAGFPDVTMWNSVDGRRFPLSRAARDADVVLDLLPDEHVASELVLDRPEGSVLSCSAPSANHLVAPGILRALADHPVGTFELGISLYQVCAAAVAAAWCRSPTAAQNRLSDTGGDQGTTEALAAALHRAAARPEADHGESRWSWRPRSS